MILIDALYINEGGGKVLLDYLIENTEKEKLDVFYLFDKRIEGSFQNIPTSRKLFVDASLINRLRAYKNITKDFNKILCFGNLPPIQKQKNATVFTYFHQLLFINAPSELKNFLKFKIQLKTLFIRWVKKNTDFWFVQSDIIKKDFINKYGEKESKVKILPFYPPITSKVKNSSIEREENSFIYVSNVSPHKNHKRLIEAFCLFYDKNKKGKLFLTVHSKHKAIYNLIKEKIDAGYPINNLGFINRKELEEYYFRAEYLVFPSLTESFGLGIIEAIDCGCKVIGADLPYTYEVCKPSLTFDPFSIESIQAAFIEATNNKVPETNRKIFNKIDILIKYLTD